MLSRKRPEKDGCRKTERGRANDIGRFESDLAADSIPVTTAEQNHPNSLPCSGTLLAGRDSELRCENLNL